MMILISNRNQPSIQLGTWNFHEIRLNDLDLFSDYMGKSGHPVNLWSSNFPYLWSLSQSPTGKVLWKIVNEMLVIFVRTKKNALHLQCLPFGPGDREKLVDVVHECMNYCREWNRGKARTRLKTINEEQLEYLKHSSKFQNLFVRKRVLGIERHYSITQLLHLRGKEFEYVRRKINKFYRNYPTAVIRPYGNEDYDDLIKLNDIWRQTSGTKYSTIYDTGYYPILVKDQQDLKQKVLIVEIEGNIVGMLVGSVLPNGQSWCALRKCMNNLDGISEALIIHFVKMIHDIDPSIELLNDGSDLGTKGLSFFKEKFRPVKNLKRYRLFLKK
ncbi:phosphatidylglycerol lysyltransferase domain-containing protein [Ammoniphilus sp. CFH 90114]|uniref:phosphatidylglycerol lysyltransferase domain-containing protein n=1 Tax=Ammoniphilus sp. CFH 90114 TaxID=2493665 RepID=UPI0013E94894|nr:phosphatidylglycerol lysyltransferase domain-containing protein [Ammoniphilus sp. CFH 90114]